LPGIRQLCETLTGRVLGDKGPVPMTVSSAHRVNSSKDLFRVFYPSGQEISFMGSAAKKPHVEEPGKVSFVGDDNNIGSGVEQADVLFMAGHGSPGKVALWNRGLFASGQKMRLGDGARPLSILALWACHTLALNRDIPDGRPFKHHADYASNSLWALWGATFEGGLKAVLGAASRLGAKPYDDRHIEQFISSLQKGTPVTDAWLDHIIPKAFPEGRPRVLFSGRDKRDCFDRLSRLSLENLGAFPPLRDNDARVLCWRTRVGDDRVDGFERRPTPAPAAR
jgi:hypothetical protein